MRAPAELTAAFRARGSKVTPQRQLLFRLLHGNPTHPTADVLFAEASAQMPGISLRTVYQTLTDLVAMGELTVLDLGTGSARFDPNGDDHHHTVCTECGLVRDLYVTGADRLEVHGLDGFVPDSTAIVLRGRCVACASSPAAAAEVSSIPVRP